MKFRKEMSLVLALVLMTTSFSTVKAETSENSKLDTQTVKDRVEQEQPEIETNKVMDDLVTGYNEGEAVILYDDSFISAFGFNSYSGMTPEYEVVSTYEFKSGEKGMRPSSVSGETDGFKVSLVRSDKYSTEKLIDVLKKNRSIKYAEPNYRISTFSMNDEYYGYQWALENNGQNKGKKGADINYDAPLSNTSKSDFKKVIAIVDTGVDYTHEDLIGRMWSNKFQNAGLEGVVGYDFVNNDSDPYDDYGHGTRCAGIIAASADNVIGMTGVTGKDDVEIMALKVMDSQGNGSYIQAIAAYNYILRAQNAGVNVVAVNNSWGTNEVTESEIFTEVINNVGKNGAISVCAAGNNSTDNDKAGCVPANLDSDYIISVAATDENDNLASFSNYGANTVDIAAPGTNIFTTNSTFTFLPGVTCNDGCSVNMGFADVELSEEMSGSNKDKSRFTYGRAYFGMASDNSEVKITNDNYWGYKDNCSLEWKIEGAKAGEVYALYLPYTTEAAILPILSGASLFAKNLTPVSLPSMVGVADIPFDGTIPSPYEVSDNLIGGITVSNNDYWTNVFGLASIGVLTKQNRAMVFYYVISQDGDYVAYIDNVGVTSGSFNIYQLKRYIFDNGTSMAAPYVTGAVALMAKAYPDDDALSRKDKILKCVRKLDGLTGLVATGGTLDLSKLTLNSDEDVDVPEIDGYQISTKSEGFRTIYTVLNTIDGKKVVHSGLVYALADHADEDDMVVGSDNYYVRSFTSTEKGLFSETEGENGYKKYIMTMKFGANTKKAYTQKYIIRSFAELDDGSYVYSDPWTYSSYEMAQELYQNSEMPTEEGHNYIYENILFVVNPDYEKVEYNFEGTLSGAE